MAGARLHMVSMRSGPVIDLAGDADGTSWLRLRRRLYGAGLLRGEHVEVPGPRV